MSGGSIGGALGTGAGLLLAPETGGTSMLIAPAMGAAGGALGAGVGSAVTGGGNPLSSAIMGGLTGLLGGAVGDASGLMDGNVAASTATDAGGSAVPTTVTSDPAALQSPLVQDGLPSTPVPPGAAQSSSFDPAAAQAANAPASPPSFLDRAGQWAQNRYDNNMPEWLGGNPSSSISGAGAAGNISGNAAKSSTGLSQYLLPAGIGLAGLNALGVFGTQGSNPVNTAPINSATTNMNSPLPQYNYNSVSTPYTGSWYTYGQRPETPMISNTVTPAARGGLIRGYANGGRVRALAMGGQPMQAPMGAAPPPVPPQGAGMPPQGMLPRPAGMPPQGAPPQQKPNPMANAAAFQQGHKIGQMLRAHVKGQGMTPDGIVTGQGKGQDDVVPAKLSQQEYVIPADVVGQLGDGSSNAGGKELDKMVTHIRSHKTSHGSKFPPKAKSPLAYIGKR